MLKKLKNNESGRINLVKARGSKKMNLRLQRLCLGFKANFKAETAKLSCFKAK